MFFATFSLTSNRVISFFDKYQNVCMLLNMIYFCYICLYKNIRYGSIKE